MSIIDYISLWVFDLYDFYIGDVVVYRLVRWIEKNVLIDRMLGMFLLR